LILKHTYIFVIVESQVIVHDVKPGFVTFVICAEFRLVNIDILPPGACMSVCCECCVLSGRGLGEGRSLAQKSPTDCGVSLCVT
jgi:hypothetical protein